MPWTISPLPPYLFQSVWQSLCPSMLLQMALVPSFLWLSNIPLRACTTPSEAAPLSVDIWLASMSWLLWWAFWTSVLVGSSGHTHHIYSVCLLTVSRKEIFRACLGYRGRSIFPSFPTSGSVLPLLFLWVMPVWFSSPVTRIFPGTYSWSGAALCPFVCPMPCVEELVPHPSGC